MNTAILVIPSSFVYFLWVAWLDRYFKSFEIAKVISYTLTTTLCIVNEFYIYKYTDLYCITLHRPKRKMRQNNNPFICDKNIKISHIIFR